MPDVGFREIQKGLRELGLTRESRVIVHTSLSAFGQGWAGMARDPFDRWQADYGALGGVRFQW